MQLDYATHQAIFFTKKVLGKEKICPVLAYHKINDLELEDKFTVRIKDFAEQMSYFYKKGFRTISLSKYVEFISQGKSIPHKHFVLTFDDGYEDFYLNALPILTKYNFQATVFIVADLAGKENEWDIKNGYRSHRLMDWTQIREIMKSGIEIGSHTLTHPNLCLCSDDALDYEIAQSKLILEEKTNCKIEFLAYPFGKFSERVKNFVIKHNYRGACAITDNNLKDKLAIGRIEITNHDSIFKIYTKMLGTYHKLKDLGFINN